MKFYLKYKWWFRIVLLASFFYMPTYLKWPAFIGYLIVSSSIFMLLLNLDKDAEKIELEENNRRNNLKAVSFSNSQINELSN